MQRAIEILQLVYAWTSTRSMVTKFAIGVMAILLVGSLLLVNHSAAPEQLVPILDNRALNQYEINGIQMAFAQEGLNEYEVNETTIRIPRSKRNVYLKAISKHDSLNADNEGQQNTFNPFLTSQQQGELRIEQRKERLKQNLTRMQQIDEAWIEYGEAQGDGPFRSKIRMAVINVKTTQQSYLSEHSIESIRAITRGTFPGLTDDEIEIIDLENDISYGNSLSQSQPQVHRIRMRQMRNELQNRIGESLSGFPDLRVTISLEETNLASATGNSGGSFFVASSQNNNAQPVNEHGSAQLVGSNGHVSLNADDSKLDKEVVQTNSNGIQATSVAFDNFERRIPVANITIGVPEKLVREILERQRESNDEPLQWNEVQQGFANLRNQIDQVVRSQIPIDQTGNVSIILEPGIDADSQAVQLQWNIAVRLWFEQNWKTVVLIVFGMCALLILRPSKISTRND